LTIYFVNSKSYEFTKKEVPPRQCIFGATTNRDTWQRDETGARRWWPVKCGPIDIDALRTDRDQLWAEARDRYLANEPWWLNDPSLVEAQEIEAEGRYEPDPWEEEIIGKTSLKNETTTSEVLCLLGLPLEKRGRSEQMRVASVLRHLGWTREREKNTGKSTRGWIYRKPTPKP
jgi:putative DNA primase/helicase